MPLDAVKAFVAFEHFVHVEVVVAVEPVVQENSRFHLWLLPIGLIGDSGVG